MAGTRALFFVIEGVAHGNGGGLLDPHSGHAAARPHAASRTEPRRPKPRGGARRPSMAFGVLPADPTDRAATGGDSGAGSRHLGRVDNSPPSGALARKAGEACLAVR